MQGRAEKKVPVSRTTASSKKTFFLFFSSHCQIYDLTGRDLSTAVPQGGSDCCTLSGGFLETQVGNCCDLCSLLSHRVIVDDLFYILF